AARQISSELVGRQRELEVMRKRFADFLSGQGGVVSIVGDAGLGKSRLLAELASSPELAEVTLLVGRCDSVGSGLSYHPFAELLRDWAGIKAGSSDDEAIAKLESACREALGDLAVDAFPFIATMMGFHPTGTAGERLHAVPPDAMENLVFKAMNDL